MQHELEYRIMEKLDIRWIQRFANYRKALHRLEQAVEIMARQDADEAVKELMKEGLIQRFENTMLPLAGADNLF